MKTEMVDRSAPTTAHQPAPAPTSSDAAVLTRRREQRPDDPVLSIVVPVRNETETIGPFLDAIDPVLDRLGLRTELVFVNDGSTDDTLGTLLASQEQDARIAIVNLTRNFGKEAALSSGFAACTGDMVVPIDVDLQDPPELLIDFVARWREGYDVVYGVRRSRRGDPAPVRWTSNLFYRLFNRLSPTPMPNDVGDFRLMDRRVVGAVQSMPERNRVMKGLFSWVGFPSIGIPFDRPARSAGAPAWTMRGRVRLAIDAITSFSAAPLRVWTYVGLFIAGGASVYAAYILALALWGGTSDVPGYASLILTVLFLGAMQLVSLGLIGEYLGRVLIEAKDRPLFLVEGIYRAEADDLSAGPATPAVPVVDPGRIHRPPRMRPREEGAGIDPAVAGRSA